MSRESVDVARRSLGAWNRGDLVAWLDTGHPEIEWISGIATEVEGTEAVYRGEAGMRGCWDEWHSLWDLTIEVSEIRDFGDAVLALGHIRTHGKTSGVDLQRPVAYVYEFEDGLVREVRAYQDQNQALEAVGLRE